MTTTTTTDTTTVVVGDEEASITAEFVKVKQLIKELTKTSDELKGRIADFLGDAETAVTADGEVLVRRSDRVRESVDIKELKKVAPEIWDILGRETAYVVYLT